MSKDPDTNKLGPLPAFRRGALTHFAVSQCEVFMATKLDGDEAFFLPFNKGARNGGTGNDISGDTDGYAANCLWNGMLLPGNLLKILTSFVYL